MNLVVHYLRNIKLLLLIGLIIAPLNTWADTPTAQDPASKAAKSDVVEANQNKEKPAEAKAKVAVEKKVVETKTPAAPAQPKEMTPAKTAPVAPEAKAQPAAQSAEATPPSPPRVRFETSMGHFIVELNPEKAPVTVKNFLSYVDSGFYTNLIFHRVISNFMIQGGGFNAEMTKAPTKAPISLESKKGLSNLRGTIAMARTNNPDSATSQFFINVVHNRNLDSYGGGYAVFGKVIEGMENVDKIRMVPTGYKAGHRDVPVNPVVILSAKRL